MHNTDTIKSIRPTFRGGADLSGTITKDNSNLLLELSVAEASDMGHTVRYHEKYTDILVFLLRQENLHVALSTDTFEARGAGAVQPDNLFVQEYIFKHRGAGIHVTLTTDLTQTTPVLQVTAEPTGDAEITARYLAGAVKKEISRLAA